MIDLGNIKLRNWQEKDINSLSKNANNKKIWNNLRDSFPYPYTKLAAKQWIKIANMDNPITNFAIEYNEKAIGGIGIIIQSDIFIKNAEIGYWIGEKYWNKGIASIALKAMVEYSFNHFDIIRLYAHVFETNYASIKVLKKCGFIEEARLESSVYKNNIIQDCFIYSIVKPENDR